MKKIRKILKYFFIIVVVLFIINIFPVFFYKQEINENPLPSYYKKGVYHMHSVFSDGKGTIDEITNSAASLNLDFLILTDHGRPNIKSSTCTSWKNDVLLIGGTELSLNSGHLAAMGYKVPDYIFPPEPQEAINEIINGKGVCFISHPFDNKIPWTDWAIYGFTGLEVLSSYSDARRAGILQILVFFPIEYLINSKYALLNTMDYPTENKNKWDSLNESGQYYGIYALDAHAKLPITKKIQLNFPTYKSMFEIMTVYVKIYQALNKNPHLAASIIISALRKGNFFNVIEGIASANGFDAVFIEGNTRRRIEIGGKSNSKKGKLVILLPFDFATEVIVLKDGRIFERKVNNQKKRCEIEIKKPGIYRIEAYVPGNTFDKLPWIMTNPFFIGVKEFPSLKKKKEEITLKMALANEKGFFKVEKNNRSKGIITYDTSDNNELITSLTFKLVKDSTSEKDFWSAMAVRKRFDFSKFKGFVFNARSDKKRRFWIEFRTGKKDKETWYRHSFLIETEWKKYNIEFNKFHVIFGERKALSLSNITSIFISINNANAYPGTKGNVDLKNLGLF